MSSSEIITMAMAAIGCAGGVTGVILSVKADRRSSRAEEESRLAKLAIESANVRELWSNLINAAQRLIGASVVAQDMHSLLVELRTASTELIDAPATKTYEHLAEWLNNEHRMINGLFAFAAESLPNAAGSIAQIELAHRPVNDWVASFVNNLRYARKTWETTIADAEFENLAKSTADEYMKLKSENPNLIPPDPRASD